MVKRECDFSPIFNYRIASAGRDLGEWASSCDKNAGMEDYLLILEGTGLNGWAV